MVAVTIGAVALAGSACGGLPDGTDGDLTGGWAAMSEPAPFVPDAQACHEEGHRRVSGFAQYQPVACDQPHLVETFHVGTFTDDAAERDNPPDPESPEARSAYQECEDHAEEYLGADFRYGPLWLALTFPPEAGWEGGARWFRCELTELDEAGDPVMRQGSLAGALEAQDLPLRHTCSRVEVGDDGTVTDQTPVSCDEEHGAEFVGVWHAPDGAYPDPEEDVEAVYDGCRSRIAEYTDVPDDGDVRYRIGTIVDWMSEEDWNAGDRGFRCRLWVDGGEQTGSLHDAGTDELPVRTE